MKTWDKKAIQDLLAQSDKAVERALLAVYGNQTQDEKLRAGTRHKNGLGFNKADAPKLSELARHVRWGGRLSELGIAYCRKALIRYWRQLADIANERESQRVQHSLFDEEKPSP